MNTVARRICLALLAVYGAYSGFWGYLAPGSWYRSFPGLGLSWVSPFGPFNEHFVKDVNAMFLAFAVLSVFAFVRAGDPRVARAAGLTWLVFNGLHLIYHLTMLGMYRPVDQLLNVVLLVVLVLLPLFLLFPSTKRGESHDTATQSGTAASAGRVHAGAQRVPGDDAAGNGDPQRH